MKKISALIALSFMLCVTAKALENEDEQKELNSVEKETEGLDLKKQFLGRTIGEQEALLEGPADTTEYTLDPSSVEMVVEMDPNNYGFRTRNYRMTLSAEADLALRGRGMISYDYWFFNHLSAGIRFGVDASALSLFNRFRDHQSKPYPQQFSILGGVSAKWRLSEWYMRKAFFLEPSLLVGHMWQSYGDDKTTHIRLRPGLFFGFDKVFDSGLALSAKIGAEFPYDFAQFNAIYELVEPLLVVGFGLAI